MNNMMPVVAWRMQAHGSSGKYKEYRLMVAGPFLIVGWGSKSMQYKIEHHYNELNAQRYGVQQTAIKEAKGYWVSWDPMQYTVDRYLLTVLERLHNKNHRGADTTIHSVFELCFTDGATLT